MFVNDCLELTRSSDREDNVFNPALGMIQRGHGDLDKQPFLAVNRAYIGRDALNDLAARSCSEAMNHL